MLLSRDAIDEGLPNHHGKSLAALAIAFACLSFVFVSMRLFTRYFINKMAGVDDYLMIVSLVGVMMVLKCRHVDQRQILALIMAASFNEEVNNGFGFHSSVDHSEHCKFHLLKLTNL